MGSDVQSAQQPQEIHSVQVYPGANGTFSLFEDDGTTYGYENGKGRVTKLTWDDASQTLKHDGDNHSHSLSEPTVIRVK